MTNSTNLNVHNQILKNFTIYFEEDDIPNIGLKVSFQELPNVFYILLLSISILLILYLFIRVVELFITRFYWVYCYYTNPNGDLDYLYTNV